MLGLENFTVKTSGNDLRLINFTGVDVQDVQIVKDILSMPGTFEIRIRTGGKGGDINVGQRLGEIENITVHSIYGSEGIECRETIPVRHAEDFPWGVCISLKKEAAAKLWGDAEKYGVLDNSMNHEFVMLLDDEVIYSAPISQDLASEIMSKTIEMDNLVCQTGLGDKGLRRGKELIIHLRAGALPVNVKMVRFVEQPTS
uniref:Protein translocase subunit SecD n=1 Tax=Candidatus Methanogaster sp. ANME-2c ERB4 TaxID=2759911 RepID=A0A7G9YAQ2_9EURY|nr:protein translocase subunit SecD [Methanosarcinales archaeon ANME-2c ERB4]QNO46062.1 protein translocase subunit SecD [Methanosarcinales archaeon ANME-2c ERB4]